MATFYIDNTTPQPQAAPASRAGGNFLSGLSQLAEAKQRGRYYDYLANVQEQKAGQQKEDDRKAALMQRALNKQLEPFHDQYRALYAKNNQSASEAIAKLDSYLMGAAKQTAAIPVRDRLKAYISFLEKNSTTQELLAALGVTNNGVKGMEEKIPELRTAAVTANNALKNSDAYIDALEDPKMFGGQSVRFINENGVVDYKFVPRNDAITYYGTRYGEDFKTGNPLDARSEAPAPALEAEPRSLSEVARRQATLTSPEYVTNVGPAVGGPILPPVEPAQPVVTEAGPTALPRAFDPEGDGYDYETANRIGGMFSSPDGHYFSRDPKSGMILKGRGHETFDKTIAGETSVGNVITKGEDGRYYSNPPLQGAPTPAPAPVPVGAAPVTSPPVAPVSPPTIPSQPSFADLPPWVLGLVDDDGNIIERRPNPNELVDPFSPEAMAENERQSNIRYYKDRLSKINQIIDDKYRQSWIDPDTKEKFPVKITRDKDKDLGRSLGYRPSGTYSIYGSKTDPNFIMPFFNIKAYEEERDLLQELLDDALSREKVTRPAPVILPEGPEPENSPLGSYLWPTQQTNQLPAVSPQVAPVGVQGNTPMRLDQLSPLMNE